MLKFRRDTTKEGPIKEGYHEESVYPKNHEIWPIIDLLLALIFFVLPSLQIARELETSDKVSCASFSTCLFSGPDNLSESIVCVILL